jgi:gamma-glutamylcyclotransferase (GGCT)/AIG2-like uncharacterized protein YtfP
VRPLVERFRPVGRASVPGTLYDLGPYPAAVFDEAAETLVWGDLVALPDDAGFVARLDEYEGFDSANAAGSPYVRVRKTATLSDGRRFNCWAYGYNRDTGNTATIPGGDYFAWRAK